ncbi:hypothetical protein J1N35_024262 [Gossypium stocksii]|uniref:Uncharacterized protein n=1 Tax=Gossypium stocksii TaxID=47602 RepID=A0A9D4A2U6_9ROSI|nr:hypothetical protein J1N35_024262 [Gossypium stocksii]
MLNISSVQSAVDSVSAADAAARFFAKYSSARARCRDRAGPEVQFYVQLPVAKNLTEHDAWSNNNEPFQFINNIMAIYTVLTENIQEINQRNTGHANKTGYTMPAGEVKENRRDISISSPEIRGYIFDIDYFDCTVISVINRGSRTKNDTRFIKRTFFSSGAIKLTHELKCSA